MFVVVVSMFVTFVKTRVFNNFNIETQILFRLQWKHLALEETPAQWDCERLHPILATIALRLFDSIQSCFRCKPLKGGLCPMLDHPQIQTIIQTKIQNISLVYMLCYAHWRSLRKSRSWPSPSTTIGGPSMQRELREQCGADCGGMRNSGIEMSIRVPLQCTLPTKPRKTPEYQATWSAAWWRLLWMGFLAFIGTCLFCSLSPWVSFWPLTFR